MPDHIRNPDPQFPNRPQHPDFWVLSEAVIENDKYGDSNRMPERLAQFIDETAVSYIAVQRVNKGGAAPQNVLREAGAWIDGFTAGCEYMRRKLEQQYGTGKSG